MIPRVTITGADDRDDPSELRRIGEEFPFVEWAFLWSPKREGSSRYPSQAWIEKAQDGLTFATHLCGMAARDAMAGKRMPAFAGGGRIQINGYVQGRGSSLADRWGNLRFILQCQREDTLQQCANDSLGMPGASVLFDPSGGRGFEPMRWPPTPCGCSLGFAGGIGPDNVLEVIGDIGPRDPYWIDMESGVRTDDRLDLSKVRRVLTQVGECWALSCGS
jgi:hypothetical protein